MAEDRAETQHNQEELAKQRLVGYEDRIRGLLADVTEKRKKPEDVARLLARGMMARDRLIERASGKAKTDALTGLPNKRYFEEEYQKRIKEGKPFALLIVDIDRFKPVNDTYGHLAGNQVLVQTGQKLSSSIRQIANEEEGRENDFLARYGGEEFIILLPGVDKREDLEKIGEKMRLSFSDEPMIIKVNGDQITQPVRVSIGGGIFIPGTDPEEFFQRVDKDALLTGAKGGGRNKVVILLD